MSILSRSEEICVDNVLENLFEFFQLLGFRMTSGKNNEAKCPTVIHLRHDVHQEHKRMETLQEIKAAGPEYVRKLHDFTTEYVRLFI